MVVTAIVREQHNAVVGVCIGGMEREVGSSVNQEKRKRTETVM
jgi:hypothetical protein